jgi:hypothetical protein
MGTTPQLEPQESDLLVPFERQNIPAEYKEYYQIKRGNFFASIQRFSEMWKYYTDLDKIWMREFDDIKPSVGTNRIFPLMLFINAHAKMRVSMELAFSGCMAEARSILRDSVEFVAHAHAMLNDPQLQKVWLAKNEEEKAFEDAFEQHKRKGVFKGLEELHTVWGQLSELGAHSNLNAIADRFVMTESDTHVTLQMNYTGLDEKIWATSIFSLLLTCFKMEETMFRDYQTRFQFDEELMRMRRDSEKYKEQLRRVLIARYNVERPAAATTVVL